MLLTQADNTAASQFCIRHHLTYPCAHPCPSRHHHHPPSPPPPLLLWQEPDAARTQADDKSDPDFNVAKDEMAAADDAAAEDPATGEASGQRVCIAAFSRMDGITWSTGGGRAVLCDGFDPSTTQKQLTDPSTTHKRRCVSVACETEHHQFNGEVSCLCVASPF